MQLLRALAELMAQTAGREAGTQTSESSGEYRLGLQLQQVEDAYMAKMESERAQPYRTLEERMIKYKRECDERARADLAAQVRGGDTLPSSQPPAPNP